MDAQKNGAIHAERLAGDVAGLSRTQEGARCAELRWVAEAPHWGVLGGLPDRFFGIAAPRRFEFSGSVRQG